jgi:hypothetical protein
MSELAFSHSEQMTANAEAAQDALLELYMQRAAAMIAQTRHSLAMGEMPAPFLDEELEREHLARLRCAHDLSQCPL